MRQCERAEGVGITGKGDHANEIARATGQILFIAIDKFVKHAFNCFEAVQLLPAEVHHIAHTARMVYDHFDRDHLARITDILFACLRPGQGEYEQEQDQQAQPQGNKGRPLAQGRYKTCQGFDGRKTQADAALPLELQIGQDRDEQQ
jgi:hypothetical protein